MNTTTRIAAAAIALFAASGSFAIEATQDFPVPTVASTTSRAAVLAQLRQAGPHFVSEASTAPVAVSTLERSRVLAESREAQRLGLIGATEAVPMPTAAQIEQIRSAGELAVAKTMAAKG